MIAENMQGTVNNMRMVLARKNGDYENLAGFFLDSLEDDIARVSGLENAAYLHCGNMPRLTTAAQAQEVLHG